MCPLRLIRYQGIRGTSPRKSGVSSSNWTHVFSRTPLYRTLANEYPFFTSMHDLVANGCDRTYLDQQNITVRHVASSFWVRDHNSVVYDRTRMSLACKKSTSCYTLLVHPLTSRYLQPRTVSIIVDSTHSETHCTSQARQSTQLHHDGLDVRLCHRSDSFQVSSGVGG